MPNEQKRQLTLGTMVIVLFSILLAVSLYVPIVNLVTSFFIAVPIAWYSAKFNRKASILVTIVSIGISYFIGGLLAVPFSMIHALLGLVIGDAIRMKKSKLFMLLSTAIVLLVTLVIQYVIVILTFEFNPVTSLLTIASNQYEQMGAFLERYNALPNNYDNTVAEVLFMFETVMPSILIISIFLLVIVFINILVPVLKILGLVVPKFPAFRNLKFPKSILWYYMVVLIVTLFVELEKGTFAFMVIANAALILRVLLILQGISFIHFYIHQQRWPKWLAIVATILAFPLQSITLIIGIFDLGFNARSYVKEKNRK
ncbi:YybS family protein [Paenisporosarcina sp.]|uniref:YybS family protein n=1 Tax=Paenisporosarcina sp. TaxID=1932001 RepID=UPI003C732806